MKLTEAELAERVKRANTLWQEIEHYKAHNKLTDNDIGKMVGASGKLVNNWRKKMSVGPKSVDKYEANWKAWFGEQSRLRLEREVGELNRGGGEEITFPQEGGITHDVDLSSGVVLNITVKKTLSDKMLEELVREFDKACQDELDALEILEETTIRKNKTRTALNAMRDLFSKTK